MATSLPDHSERETSEISSNRDLFVCLHANGLPIAVPTGEEGWTDPDEEGRSVLQTFYEDTIGVRIKWGHIAIDPETLCIRFYKFTDVKPAGTVLTEDAARYGH